MISVHRHKLTSYILMSSFSSVKLRWRLSKHEVFVCQVESRIANFHVFLTLVGLDSSIAFADGCETSSSGLMDSSSTKTVILEAAAFVELFAKPLIELWL
jgi:hypothetical protein